MATVCKDLRKVALAECSLWTELPRATLDNVHKLIPFFHRSDRLGMDLWIDEISQNQVYGLCNMLWGNLRRVGSLTLFFKNEDPIDDLKMSAFYRMLSHPTLLLENLQLSVSDYLDPLDALPRIILGYRPHPWLRSLVLTAFTLESVCPAFANLTFVSISVASLCPFEQASLPTGAQQQWANTPLHRHFPAIRSLELLGIEPYSAEDASAYSLVRMPYIDRPLEELFLLFEPAHPCVGDVETARWISEGTVTHNVRELVLQLPDSEVVRDGALMALTGAPLSLRIKSCGGNGAEITASTAEGKLRAARLLETGVMSHLKKILDSPVMPVKELYLTTNAALANILPLFAEHRQLETLGLVYEVDPLFPAAPAGVPALHSVRTLRFESSRVAKVDASDIVTFAAAVVPRITTLIVSQSITLLHPHVLPPTLHVGRMD
ncbi:hypothetical protein AURDEDRAFT_129739 [Auricularia subglabra TFB-10046 SS5]|uniref:F-box domain-containing protein n=1 Tax=Auricularia subglabra (strain TFB-10046 / SS5) TaxID=717982 RepID=J0LGZ0_AURST|nr:hypothetical protein AURDEDRAFT_129739 [Auricularia subglabra TFB-10046 SS5]